jgi:transcriptional regulator with XRE-family HTH domain
MNKDSQIIFGENVRRLRRKIGWSQEQLAEACNLHRTYIGSIERGERNVSLHNIVKIALALGVKPANLIGGV